MDMMGIHSNHGRCLSIKVSSSDNSQSCIISSCVVRAGLKLPNKVAQFFKEFVLVNSSPVDEYFVRRNGLAFVPHDVGAHGVGRAVHVASTLRSRGW